MEARGFGEDGDSDPRVYISSRKNVWICLDLLQTDANNKIAKSKVQFSLLQNVEQLHQWTC